MKIRENLKPGQYSWQYLENEVERLRQQLVHHPLDASIHQELGISLYYLNRWLYRNDAVTHLQQAERLFDSQQEFYRAAIARVIKILVSWNC